MNLSESTCPVPWMSVLRWRSSPSNAPSASVQRELNSRSLASSRSSKNSERFLARSAGGTSGVAAALKLITFPTMRRSRIDHHICSRKAASPGKAVRCSWSAFNRHWWSIRGRRQQYRKFKPPFSPCTTVSPGRQAVNRANFGENSLLAMTIRPLNRPELPYFDAFLPLRASAGRARSSATLCRAALVLNVRPPGRAPAAVPVSAAALWQASPGA